MEIAISDYIHKKIAEGFFIGAEVYVEKAGQILCHEAYGKASLRPEEKKLIKNQIYDLASVTKIVTSTILLKLIEEGKCSLDDKLSHYVHGFGQVSDEITIKHMLTHTSGLPAWYPLYAKKHQEGHTITDILEVLESLTIIPGEKMEYSDLNFILLGKVIQIIENKTLDQVVREKLAMHLNMTYLQYNPPKALVDHIIPTEWGNRIEQKMVRDRKLFYEDWRQDVIHGEVNDGNAHYYLHGVSGHAGLFGTIEDIAELAKIYLNNHYLSEDIIEKSSRNYTSKVSEGRGLGWVVDEELRGFGHTGFTGSSLWIVPSEELSIILLTSRLHQEEVRNIQPVRKELYRLILNELIK